MPTPPFSQDRRDWLDEVFGLIAPRKGKGKAKNLGQKELGSSSSLDLKSKGSSTDHGAAAKNKAMGDGARRFG